MRTLGVLSSLLLDKNMDDINISESLILQNQHSSISSGQMDLQSSMKKGVLANKNYQKADSNTVIKVLLRCKLLYSAMEELKKLLALVIKQQDLFIQPDGPVYKHMNKYINQPNFIGQVSPNDKQTTIKSIQVLLKISRKIAHFLNDYPIFRNFIFDNIVHQETLFQHAQFIRQFNLNYCQNEIGMPIQLGHHKQLDIKK